MNAINPNNIKKYIEYNRLHLKGPIYIVFGIYIFKYYANLL